MGTCVLGMGDCGSKITNITTTITTTLNENIKQTMINLTSNTSVFSQALQSVSVGQINAIGCSIDVGPISQNMQVTTDFTQLSKIVTEDTYNQTMSTAIDNAVKSDSNATSGFMSAGADVTNVTGNYNTNISRVLNSYNYASFQNLMQQMNNAQTVGFQGFNMICTETTSKDPACGANLCLGGITQNMVISMIASQISSAMQSTIAQVLQEAQTKATADNASTVVATGMFQDIGNAISGITGSFVSAISLTLLAPLIIVVVIVLAVALAIWAWRKFNAQPEISGQPGVATPMADATPLVPIQTSDQFLIDSNGIPIDIPPPLPAYDAPVYDAPAIDAPPLPAYDAPVYDVPAYDVPIENVSNEIIPQQYEQPIQV